MSDKHSLILEFLGLSPGEWQDSRVEEYFAKEYGALAKLLDQHAAEQREMCADAVTYAWNHRNFDQSSYELMLRDACLNTTGESDDKNT